MRLGEALADGAAEMRCSQRVHPGPGRAAPAPLGFLSLRLQHVQPGAQLAGSPLVRGQLEQHVAGQLAVGLAASQRRLDGSQLVEGGQLVREP